MHAQRTLQRPQFTSEYPSPALGQADPREDDGPVLRFGFTFQHVEALARRAVRDHSQSRGRDWEDRYEAAWGAAVERLYSADEPVSALDLLQAATRGLRRMAQAYLRDRGYAWSRSGGGISATPSFWSYWSSPESASPEEAVVDLAALEQVMVRLSPPQAEALRALAEHGSHQAAADALGVSPSALDNRLGRARSAFLALWHEHEAPPGSGGGTARPSSGAGESSPRPRQRRPPRSPRSRKHSGAGPGCRAGTCWPRSPPPTLPGSGTGTRMTWPGSCADTRSPATGSRLGRTAAFGGFRATGWRRSPPPSITWRHRACPARIARPRWSRRRPYERQHRPGRRAGGSRVRRSGLGFPPALQGRAGGNGRSRAREGRVPMGWLMMKSPAKLAEERAQALRDAARASRAQAAASEQGRLEVLGIARELHGHLTDSLQVSKGVDHVGRDVRAVGAEVHGLSRKIDSMHESVETFLAQAASGAFGAEVQESLSQALAAAQSVDMVGQDVRQVGKEVAALRDWIVGLLEGEQEPRPAGKHRKTDDGGKQPTAAGAGVQDGQESAGTGAAPGETGLGPDEERYLW